MPVLFRLIPLITVVLLIAMGAAVQVGEARPEVPALAYREARGGGRQSINLYDLQSGIHIQVGTTPEITFIGWTDEGVIALKAEIEGDWTTYAPDVGWEARTRSDAPNFPIIDIPYAPESQYLALRGVAAGWDVYRVDGETLDEDPVLPLQSLPDYPRVIWAPDEDHLLHFETAGDAFILRHVDLFAETATIIYHYPFGEISSTLFSADKRWMVLRVRSSVVAELDVVVIDLVTGSTHTVARNRPRLHLIGFEPRG